MVGNRKRKSKIEEGHWEGKKDECKERRIQEWFGSGKEMKRIQEKRVEKEMWKRRVRMRINSSSTVNSKCQLTVAGFFALVSKPLKHHPLDKDTVPLLQTHPAVLLHLVFLVRSETHTSPPTHQQHHAGPTSL